MRRAKNRKGKIWHDASEERHQTPRTHHPKSSSQLYVPIDAEWKSVIIYEIVYFVFIISDIYNFF